MGNYGTGSYGQGVYGEGVDSAPISRRLEWDKTGERLFEAGVDRGVLYTGPNLRGVVWNGLTEVSENPSGIEVTPRFFDGLKFMDSRTEGEYSANLKAFTYPDEFLPFDGLGKITTGMFATNQPVRETFGFSYRTKVGDDQKSTELGYKIHLVYNVTAVPESRGYSTISQTIDPLVMGWSLTAIPVLLPDMRPTAHIILDSRDFEPGLVMLLEDILYGNGSNLPRLPSPTEIANMIENYDSAHLIEIIDNFDGTWTAIGPPENIFFATDVIAPIVYEHFGDPTYFIIDGVDAVYLDEDTYDISDT